MNTNLNDLCKWGYALHKDRERLHVNLINEKSKLSVLPEFAGLLTILFLSSFGPAGPIILLLIIMIMVFLTLKVIRSIKGKPTKKSLTSFIIDNGDQSFFIEKQDETYNHENSIVPYSSFLHFKIEEHEIHMDANPFSNGSSKFIKKIFIVTQNGKQELFRFNAKSKKDLSFVAALKQEFDDFILPV